MSETLGPNVKKLIIHKVSLDAIPKGGGIKAGLEFLQDKERIIKTFRESADWVKQVIQAIRQAKEPNPFKDASDEEIAGELLKKIEERQNEKIREAQDREAKEVHLPN